MTTASTRSAGPISIASTSRGTGTAFPVQADDFELVTGQGDAVLFGGAGVQDAKKHLLTFFHADRIARTERTLVLAATSRALVRREI